MGLWEEIRSIKSGPKQLKEFGLVVGSALILLGGWLWWRKGLPFLPEAYAGTALIVAGLLKTRLLKPFQKAWMALALAMGWVMGRVILTVLFCLVVCPIGFWLKVRGKKFLEHGPDAGRPSYWEAREAASQDPVHCEKQY